MSFQDVPSGGRPSSSSSAMASKSPSQAVAAGIFQINTAVAAFRRLVDAIGTAKDTPDHRQKVKMSSHKVANKMINRHNTRQRILQLVKETSAKLKTLSESDHDPTVIPSKKIEDAKLARDFQNTLQEFQKVQQLASERESTYSPAAPPPSLPTTSGSDDSWAPTLPQEKQPFFMEQRRQEVILLGNEIAFNEAMIEEREQGIRAIEEQIGQVTEIFKDLAVLVHEQGVVIDDVSSNIDSSSAATIQARVQLAKASKSVKSRTSWCWWVLVIFVLMLRIVLMCLYKEVIFLPVFIQIFRDLGLVTWIN
ncbi:syntaxin-22-like isoform X3 [Durio zibethinus]|uniref:Syntaxin-22-like isoform X3 n=1 Tax=Durio zibethinus TaxID=66656 RepID=A0A6P5YH24_DURZI|nr:syntaxin-22-like isoform X3 [Durio zibethinus]